MLSLAPTLIAAANEDGEGFHGPSLNDFFPSAFFGDGTFFEFNRVLLVRLIITAVLMLILIAVASRATVVPTRGQSVLELLFEFVRKNVVDSVLGEKEGKRHEGLITFFFITIFAFNVTGIIPGLNIASTGLIALPLLMAVITWVWYLVAGIARHGFRHYVKKSLFPPGVPLLLKPLIAFIDFLQVLFIRPASLAVRLTVNMLVGHLLLVLTYSATQYFWSTAPDDFNLLYGLLTFAAILFMTVLELFVAGLQAFIFAMLSAVYIDMAVAEEH